MKKAIETILNQLEKDCEKWEVPENVIIIDKYADAYAIGFQEAIKQIRLRINRLDKI